VKVATGISWRVESDFGAGPFPGTLLRFLSRQAGASPTKHLSTSRPVAPGEVWTVYADYLTGNSGRFIQEQEHVRLIFY
jgi:hypothetical protein